MFWDIINKIIDILMPILLIYYVYKSSKLQKRLDIAIQRLFDETTNKLNNDT